MFPSSLRISLGKMIFTVGWDKTFSVEEVTSVYLKGPTQLLVDQNVEIYGIKIISHV